MVGRGRSEMWPCTRARLIGHLFLSDQPAPTIERMLDHIDYIVDLIGWWDVARSTDWPLQAPLDVRKSGVGDERLRGLRLLDADNVVSIAVGGYHFRRV